MPPTPTLTPRPVRPSDPDRRLIRAFTLIELVVVIVVIALLLGLAAFAYTKFIAGSRETSARAVAVQVAKAIQGHSANHQLAYGEASYGETGTHPAPGVVAGDLPAGATASVMVEADEPDPDTGELDATVQVSHGGHTVDVVFTTGQIGTPGRVAGIGVAATPDPAPSPSPSSGPPEGEGESVTLVVPAGAVSEDLPGFPVAVDLADLPDTWWAHLTATTQTRTVLMSAGTTGGLNGVNSYAAATQDIVVGVPTRLRTLTFLANATDTYTLRINGTAIGTTTATSGTEATFTGFDVPLSAGTHEFSIVGTAARPYRHVAGNNGRIAVAGHYDFTFVDWTEAGSYYLPWTLGIDAAHTHQTGNIEVRSAGTPLPVDVVDLDPAARTGRLFFRADLNAETDNTFTLLTGADATAPSEAATQAVWAGYDAVVAGTLPVNRATGNPLAVHGSIGQQNGQWSFPGDGKGYFVTEPLPRRTTYTFGAAATLTAFGGDQHFVSYGPPGAGSTQVATIALANNSSPDRFGMWNSSNGWGYGPPAVVGERLRMVSTYDSGTTRQLFVNGTEVASGGASARPGGTGDPVFYVGTGRPNSGNSWNGTLDVAYLRPGIASPAQLAAETHSWENPSTFYQLLTP